MFPLFKMGGRMIYFNLSTRESGGVPGDDEDDEIVILWIFLFYFIFSVFFFFPLFYLMWVRSSAAEGGVRFGKWGERPVQTSMGSEASLSTRILLVRVSLKKSCDWVVVKVEWMWVGWFSEMGGWHSCELFMWQRWRWTYLTYASGSRAHSDSGIREKRLRGEQVGPCRIAIDPYATRLDTSTKISLYRLKKIYGELVAMKSFQIGYATVSTSKRTGILSIKIWNNLLFWTFPRFFGCSWLRLKSLSELSFESMEKALTG